MNDYYSIKKQYEVVASEFNVLDAAILNFVISDRELRAGPYHKACRGGVGVCEFEREGELQLTLLHYYCCR